MAEAGGRIADSTIVCFCLSWEDDQVDLDLRCKMPGGEECSYENKTPGKGLTLDVDRRGGSNLQVENIFLTAAGCPDGEYQYFVRYYSGHGKVGAVDFTIVLNQFGKKIEEGTAKAEIEYANVPCLTLTMKEGKVVDTKFHIKTKEISLKQARAEGQATRSSYQISTGSKPTDTDDLTLTFDIENYDSVTLKTLAKTDINKLGLHASFSAHVNSFEVQPDDEQQTLSLYTDYTTSFKSNGPYAPQERHTSSSDKAFADQNTRSRYVTNGTTSSQSLSSDNLDAFDVGDDDQFDEIEFRRPSKSAPGFPDEADRRPSYQLSSSDEATSSDQATRPSYQLSSSDETTSSDQATRPSYQLSTGSSDEILDSVIEELLESLRA